MQDSPGRAGQGQEGKETGPGPWGPEPLTLTDLDSNPTT